jgi:hypothetical protein
MSGLSAAQIWNVAGLFLSLIGILLLFRYGMPYRVRSKGESVVVARGVDEEGLRLDWIYGVWGWIGLVLVVAGTFAQIVGNLI